jgi:hypothetical protein
MRWLWVLLRAVIALAILFGLLMVSLAAVLMGSYDEAFARALQKWHKLIAWVKEPLQDRAVLATEHIK